METTSLAARRLNEIWAEIRELQATMDLLEWDARTYQPEHGHQAKGRNLANLSGLIHRRLVDQELQEILAACKEESTPGSLLAAQVACAHLEVDRARNVPESLAKAITRAASSGLAAWEKARTENSFAPFRQPLEHLLSLKKEEAAAISPAGRAYDVQLQQFEPGATQTQLEPLFEHLESELSAVVHQYARLESDSQPLGNNPLLSHFPEIGQEKLVREIASALGFDFSRGRLDASTHPFCVGLHPSDVRMTWRCRENDLRPALAGILHETGHGLYEQGMPTTAWGTPIGRDASCGLHESQARLWENYVGLHPGFWEWLTPRIAAIFPTASAPAETYRQCLRRVQPSPIRIDADPTTYNLHIAIRFDLEKRLFAGELDVRHLPGAWNELYDRLLGIQPAHPVEGVLQDVHWAEGMFGYFPTYTLGNMAAAQLFAAAESELGDFEPLFRRGDFEPLRQWLQKHIHRHASRYSTAELISKATGQPLSAQALSTYLANLAKESIS